MIRVQIVIAGGAIGQTVAVNVGLPDRIRTPQALLCGLRVEAVRFAQ